MNNCRNCGNATRDTESPPVCRSCLIKFDDQIQELETHANDPKEHSS